jgi:hypothetical protein
MEFMAEHELAKLPHPDVIVEKILTRDFSEYEVVEGDDEATKDQKRKDMAMIENLMDCWTDKLVPAVAGAKLWHPKVRHFEPMTTSLMQNSTEQLKIPASTEAMTALTYINNHGKWNATHKWCQQNAGRSGVNCPRYSSKNPDKHVNFMAKFSDASVGQAKWGGWSDEGKKLFVTLQKKIIESRNQNHDRHVQVDEECVERLYNKFADMHKNSGRDPKKNKTNPEIPLDDDPEFDFIYEA